LALNHQNTYKWPKGTLPFQRLASRLELGAARLGSGRLASLERAEPSLFFELVFAASRAGSFQLASLAKMINL
jgi:hypothetical protein